MMAMLESGEQEKQELMDEMKSMTDLNNLMKEELDKKNAYLKNFADGLETVKSNVEQERQRNEGISTHMETLNKQLEIRDTENEKLLAFADVSRQTVDQMERKIKLLEETLENRTNETGHIYKKINCLELESEEKDKLID
jgi:CII-binding regulator of phage lambda lysogenization HflD